MSDAADYQDNQYWATEALTAHEVNVVNLNTGGGSFTLSVEKESGSPLVDVPVYVFTSSGSYLGISAQTDAQGQVTFDLGDGDYKFRADYFGYQFWSNDYAVAGTISGVLAITHQDVTVTVNQVNGVDIDPLQGINVYLFTGAGSYQGITQATDANGQVTFNLPEKDYKVRADYLSAQYWSDVFSWQDLEVDINHGTAVLHVTESGQDLFDVPVYLFTESGLYLGRFERTDSSGQVEFLLPANSYKFRVDYDGTQYWSDVISILPHEENNVDLQLELLADLTHDPNPDRIDGVPPEYELEKIMVASLSSIRGLLVQSVVGQTAETQKIYYFINDHLGTPQKLLDENADVVWKADYKPFGEAEINVNTFANQFRFPGQYYDTVTGLNYNYHRYYDPTIGRYLRADPIGLTGGINVFLYANANSINFIDPSGLDFFTDYDKNLRETNRFFFEGATSIIRTGTGLITSGTVARTFGTVTPLQAARSLMQTPAGITTLGVGGTLVAAGANTVINAATGALFLEAGIGFGSLISSIPVYVSEETIGTWWGNFFWDLLHKEKEEEPCE